MMGDAPGDCTAAWKNGILFYPIRPLEETDSWEEFYTDDLERFLNGSYAGEREKQLVEQFRHLLPATPGWE